MKRELYINFSATDKFEEISYELKAAVRSAVYATLERESFKYPAEVSVTFCSAEYIHELNKQYRGVDRPTDVLSFPLYENGEFDEAECQFGAPLGDIVISVPRAKEQALELGNSFLREVAFLTIHSTLHLLGYDHERSDEDDELQCRLQREIIETIDIK
ncbi:MAG: rRNA maturation RNase YbeY [Ruminococcaceae bacterium]|nr:rRNA maturation RNase YbeY [Oscillospiraceae bacterium]